jgi:hypothetical protein
LTGWRKRIHHPLHQGILGNKFSEVDESGLAQLIETGAFSVPESLVVRYLVSRHFSC